MYLHMHDGEQVIYEDSCPVCSVESGKTCGLADSDECEADQNGS